MPELDDFQWLTHPSIAPLSQRFHIGAIGFWTGRGWIPCDPPTEHNTVTAEHPAFAEPSADAGPDVPAEPAKGKKTGAPATEGTE